MTTKNKRLRSNYDSAGCPPGWAWLLAGIVIGIFISFLIYLREFAPHSLPPERTQVTAPITTQPVETVAEETPKASDRFDFYDILPGHEIKIPSKGNKEEPLEVTVKGRYLLQVGLFKGRQEAQGLKNYLLSLGMPTNIVPAPFSATESGYRVQVGPFSDLAKLNHTRALLSSNNISAILLKFSGDDIKDMLDDDVMNIITPTDEDLVTDDSTEWNGIEEDLDLDKILDGSLDTN